MTETGTARGVSDAERLSAVRRSGMLDSGPEESFERLGRLARRLVGAPVALVSLVDVDRQHFKCCLGLAEPYATAGETPLSHSICQYALAGPEPLVIPDARLDPRLTDNLAITELNAVAYLGIPLVNEAGFVLGSFCVLDEQPREWTDDQVQVMADLAQSVMSEIDLRELALERRVDATLLEQSESRLRAIIDSLFIFVGLLDTAGTLLEANAAALDAAGLELDDVVGCPFWDTYWWSWDKAAQDQLRRAIERGARGETSRYDANVRLGDGTLTSIDFQLVPVRDEAGDVAALVPSGLDISDRKRFEEDLGRLAELESTQRKQAEDLLRLAEGLTKAVTVDDIVGELIGVGASVVGAAFANIALRTDNGRQLELRHGAQLDEAISDRWPHIALDATTPLGACLSSAEPVLISSMEEIEESFPVGAADARQAGFEALASLPTHGRLAAVGFAWTSPVEFTPTLRNALEFVAQLTGQALERASLFERERLVADRLQRSLLPQALPSIPAADVAARYEAGADGLLVGGDWYDAGPLRDDRWVLAVGDLVGHGVSAASAMGQLRSAFSALATNADDIRPLVERMDLVANEIPDARLGTMVAVEYDSSSGRLSIVSAGHPPTIIRRADGSIERIEGGGPPLGYATGLTRESFSSSLGPGDSLLLYTDGLIERRGEHIDEGLARLEQVLGDLAGLSASELCDAVYEQLAAGAEDDIALLAMIT